MPVRLNRCYNIDDLRRLARRRAPTATLPRLKTLRDADVLMLTKDGDPIRGIRSRSDGSVPVAGLVGVEPGEQIILLASRGTRTKSKVITTQQTAHQTDGP